MSKKQEAEDFIYDLLKEAGLRSIKRHSDGITCECPFHGNTQNFKTFRVSTVEECKKATEIYPYHCFSCHAKGGIYMLIAKLMEVPIRKAIKIFKRKVVLSQISLSSLSKAFNDIGKTVKALNMPTEEITLPPSSKNKKVMYDYLESRSRLYHGVLDVHYIVRLYELYYCGLGRCSGRIIMPIKNIDGTVVEFNNRSVNKNAKLKVLYSTNSDIYMILHGLSIAIGHKKVVIVEGSFDMYQIMSAIKGDSRFADFGVVNNMGTTCNEEKILTLLKYFDEVYLLFDHDEAGLNATELFYEQLKDDVKVKICTRKIPKGKDPGKCRVREIKKALLKPESTLRKTMLDKMLEENF